MGSFSQMGWINRLMIAGGIFAVGLLVYWLFNQYAKTRLSGAPGKLPFEMHVRAAILYFTSPDCVPCKTIQQPALRKLSETMGADALQIVQVNTLEEPELAREWRVMTVPTTFVIDGQGVVRHINHGVANLEKLEKQVAPLLTQ